MWRGVDDQIGVLFDGMAAVDDVFSGPPKLKPNERWADQESVHLERQGPLRTSSCQHGKNRCDPRSAKSTT